MISSASNRFNCLSFNTQCNWPLKPGSLSSACSVLTVLMLGIPSRFPTNQSGGDVRNAAQQNTSEMLPAGFSSSQFGYYPLTGHILIGRLATLPMALSPGYIRCCCLKISTHLNQPDTSSPKLRGQPSSRISSQRIAISLL